MEASCSGGSCPGAIIYGFATASLILIPEALRALLDTFHRFPGRQNSSVLLPRCESSLESSSAARSDKKQREGARWVVGSLLLTLPFTDPTRENE